MLDLKYIKDNPEQVKENIKNRFMQADVDETLKLYELRNRKLQELEALRRDRNDNASKMKGKLPQEERSLLIEEGKRLKEAISLLEEETDKLQTTLFQELKRIPNLAHPGAPVGKEEKDNLEIRRWGTVPQFNFTPKDHVQIGADLDILDFDTATKVSGQKFYYLKNQAVFLEMALVRYALDLITAEGFTPFITPDIAREEIVEGIGFNPRGSESNIYTLEGTGSCLVGTAEITLGGYYSDQILERESLPLRLAGLSHCFRKEAGAAGQYSKGLYRVHQFTKVEMFVYCEPSQSEREHENLLRLEEILFQGLEIPYRVVDTCTGDLGAPAYRKFDLEAWMPGRGDWGEVTSSSNCTDYQARRLGVRYREEGKTRFVHMLNGTALAVSRAMVAILENFQQEDGTVKLPKALVPYTGFERLQRK